MRLRPRPLVVLGAVLGVLLGMFGVATASAHATLESSVPADGANLPAPPDRVTLTFGEDIATVGVAVLVTGPTGTVTSGAPGVRGPVVTQRLTPGLSAGAYAVTFRVVSADGHPVSGQIHFTVGVPASTTTARTSPVPTSSPSARVSDRAAPPGGPAPAVPLGVAALVLAALIVGSLAWRRRRPGRR